ncbi:MAG: hypothetical protein EZS28_006135 [Streblomastix strix]|uniref:Uncharacterized protein n=1 Tax=Streblomastix strix TaxID=222440 RepID=A0A5J4WVU4_9EUKA|nr:MAG: hypothetical protein EZS28_006135 [Streblomastix strix]
MFLFPRSFKSDLDQNQLCNLRIPVPIHFAEQGLIIHQFLFVHIQEYYLIAIRYHSDSQKFSNDSDHQKENFVECQRGMFNSKAHYYLFDELPPKLRTQKMLESRNHRNMTKC